MKRRLECVGVYLSCLESFFFLIFQSKRKCKNRVNEGSKSEGKKAVKKNGKGKNRKMKGWTIEMRKHLLPSFQSKKGVKIG